MQDDGYTFMVDAVSKFHHTVYAAGWLVHDTDWLVGAELQGPGIIDQIAHVGLRHGGIDPVGEHGRGFRVQCLRIDDTFPDELTIVFITRKGKRIEARLIELAAERLAQSSSTVLYSKF